MVTALFAAIITTPAQSFLTNGLLAYYPFNGNTADASFYKNDGVNNGATFVADRFGNPNSACNFDRSQSQYIALPMLTDLIGSSFATYSFWVKVNTNTDGTIIGVWGDNYGAVNLDLGLTTQIVGGGLIDTFNNSGVGEVISVNPVPNGWHQVVIVFNGSNSGTTNKLTYYVDGNPFGSINTGIVNSVVGTPKNIFIGRRNFDFGRFGGYYNGTVDDVRIYNRSLLSDEVAQLYAFESAPSISVQKAVYLTSANLKIGTNYQIQVSTDLVNWTNSGSVFTATSNVWHSAYWDIPSWNQIFFRINQQ